MDYREATVMEAAQEVKGATGSKWLAFFRALENSTTRALMVRVTGGQSLEELQIDVLSSAYARDHSVRTRKLSDTTLLVTLL